MKNVLYSSLRRANIIPPLSLRADLNVGRDVFSQYLQYLIKTIYKIA